MNKTERAPCLPGVQGRNQLHRAQAEVQGSPEEVAHTEMKQKQLLPMFRVYSPPRSRYIRYTK